MTGRPVWHQNYIAQLFLKYSQYKQPKAPSTNNPKAQSTDKLNHNPNKSLVISFYWSHKNPRPCVWVLFLLPSCTLLHTEITMSIIALVMHEQQWWMQIGSWLSELLLHWSCIAAPFLPRASMYCYMYILHLCTVLPLSIQTLCKLHRHVTSPNVIIFSIRKLHSKHLHRAHAMASNNSTMLFCIPL